jgi:LCP family protein required for cell wall assembly
MRKSPLGIDGFMPRRPTRSVGDAKQASEHQLGQVSNPTKIGEAVHQISSIASSVQVLPKPVSKSDINDSLDQIDDEEAQVPKRRSLFRRRHTLVRHPRRKWLKRSLLLFMLALIALGGFVGVKALLAGSNIFQGSIFDIFQHKPLKVDANGRTNILILGSTDDDPNHPGNTLTDTIMVISIDQKKKEAAMFSLPRDLWVKYGQACTSGYEGKLNGYFYCSNGEDSKEAEQQRLKSTEQFIGNIVGLDIQYGVHVNSVVVRDAVVAVGGIDVEINSKDPRGILDRNFDAQCNYKCYKVKYNNGTHHIDGEAAMYLSMARGANGGYGLGSNFEREQNQQSVIMALQKKATSSGVLSNPAAVTGLIDTVGNNLRTNFEASEIQTLIGLAKDIPASKIMRIQLNSESNPVVTTGNVGPASIVRTVEGLYEYKDLQRYIKKQIDADPITREAATLAVYNGSGINGFGRQKGDSLEELGFIVGNVSTAPTGTYDAVEIYDMTGSKPSTKAKLESTYNVKTKTTTPPVQVTGIDFVIIYGKQPASNQ